MNITIHRDGFLHGSCVEIECGGDRILLDLGVPMPSDLGQSRTARAPGPMQQQEGLPPIDGLYAGSTPGVRAVLVSHAHPDHIGFTPWVHPDIPVFATRGTWALFEVSQLFQIGPIVNVSPNRNEMPKNKRLDFGALTVTAIPVDHSAPDAVAFLVEGGGKRVLYSGDLRAHGRKSYLWKQLKNSDFKGQLDALLLEGTNIGRPARQAETEQALEEKLVRDLKNQTDIALVCCSPQNLDRVVTLYRAAIRLNRTLVIDIYSAYVLHALRSLSPHIPQWDWPLMRVISWRRQVEALANGGQEWFVKEVRRNLISLREIQKRQSTLIFLTRSNSTLKREIFQDLEKAKVYWAQWTGYWKDDKFMRDLCERKGFECKPLHTSGHASWKDLKELAHSLQPQMIIPIHTEQPDRFAAELPGVVLPRGLEIISI